MQHLVPNCTWSFLTFWMLSLICLTYAYHGLLKVLPVFPFWNNSHSFVPIWNNSHSFVHCMEQQHRIPTAKSLSYLSHFNVTSFSPSISTFPISWSLPPPNLLLLNSHNSCKTSHYISSLFASSTSAHLLRGGFKKLLLQNGCLFY